MDDARDYGARGGSKPAAMAVALLAFAFVLLGLCQGDGAARSRSDQGVATAGFLQGVNMPWYNWRCDFGCRADGGVTSTAETLAPRFAALQAAGVRHVRWWLFEGEAWQIARDAAGVPTQVQPSVYQDLDAAIELGRRYELAFTFVLFSAPSALPSAWLKEPRAREPLALALRPLFQRYAHTPEVFAWEVFNEPEWEMWNGTVEPAAVQATVRAIASEVRRSGPTHVTVGSAALDGLRFWTDAGLTFYEAHWYDEMGDGERCALCTDYAAVRARYNLDGPLVIGEFYAGRDVDSLARYEAFLAKGYSGAWGWSLWPERTDDGLAVDLAAAAEFATRHPVVKAPGVRCLALASGVRPASWGTARGCR